MPPEVSPCHPIVTPLIQFLPQQPPRSQGTKRMTITKKKLLPILVFALSAFSILRLLNISAFSSFTSPPTAALPPSDLHTCSSPTLACTKTPLQTQGPSNSPPMSSAGAAVLTEKEYRLLSNLISLRAPCNLLVFGLEQQHLNLSRINAGGNTVILEDNPEKLNTIKTNYNNTRIHRVEYQTLAGEAYKLLKHARQNPACGLHSGSLKNSSCPLALTRLPREVYKRNWDVVVVDGPSGDRPDGPGRMAAIYTASLLARAGNMTDVLVHDADRMIEKWFAWEFLCEENLVSSKGKPDAMAVLCAAHAYPGPIHRSFGLLPFSTGRCQRLKHDNFRKHKKSWICSIFKGPNDRGSHHSTESRLCAEEELIQIVSS